MSKKGFVKHLQDWGLSWSTTVLPSMTPSSMKRVQKFELSKGKES